MKGPESTSFQILELFNVEDKTSTWHYSYKNKYKIWSSMNRPESTSFQILKPFNVEDNLNLTLLLKKQI